MRLLPKGIVLMYVSRAKHRPNHLRRLLAK